jgi:hypothetical protein
MEQLQPLRGSDSCDFENCIKAQIAEVEKYKWLLGEQIGHDPLQDKTLNEIYTEWIQKYAADYRKWWESRKNNS